MNNLKQILVSALVAGLVAGVVSVFGVMLVGNQLADSQNLGAVLGITRYPNSGLSAHYLKLTDSPATSTAGAEGSLTVGGLAQVDKLAFGGTAYLALATPTTLTPAQVCGTRTIDMTPTSTAQITFPSATNLISSTTCLGEVGAQKWLYIRNLGTNVASTTNFVAGASTTIAFEYSSSTLTGATSTLYGGDSANVQIIYATSSDASSAKVEINILKFR